MSDHTRKGYIDSGRSIEIIVYWAERSSDLIRVITGYFTIKGYNSVRKYFRDKRLSLIVGIEEPADDRARRLLIKEIFEELRKGLDRNRFQAVQELVDKMRDDQFFIIDARALDHHAKVYIFDKKAALVTSSNFTFKGLHDRDESGLPTTDPVEVQGFIEDFQDLYNRAHDITVELLERLERWLQLRSPWEIYLKTLLSLEGYQSIEAQSKSYRFPVSYQKFLVTRALNGIREHGGHMIVAQTGLGKTVIGTEVARLLHATREITHVYVIGPAPVQQEWENHLLTAGVPCRYLVHQNLNFTDVNQSGPLTQFMELVERMMDENWLIIVDESHTFRNRYREIYEDGQLTTKEKLAYKRLLEARQNTQAKILLLTGTPYSKDKDDINYQLALLPHTAKPPILNEFRDLLTSKVTPKPWRVSSPEELKELDEVATVLTTPVVVRNWAKHDDNNYPYITFGNEKRYFPRIKLLRADTEVFLPELLVPVLSSDILRLKGDYAYDHNTGEVTNAHILWSQRAGATKAWASSPWALRSRLKTIITEEDYEKGYLYSHNERVETLSPVIDEIDQMRFDDDPKLQMLLHILDELISQGRKIIIFCLYGATIGYLETALNILRPDWQVFGTVYSDPISLKGKPTNLVKKAIYRFAPISNGKNPEGIRDSIDIFISTDRFGVGVNMQDADVVINYDLPWDAIAPNQRAGRILRPWKDHRTIQIYVFVPNLPNDTPEFGHFKMLERHWQKLVSRHQASAQLLDLPVITTLTSHDVNMLELGRIIELGEIEYETLSETDLETSTILSRHMALLEHNRSKAQSIEDDITSALISDDARLKFPRIFLLVYHGSRYHPIVMNVKSGELLQLTDARVLDLIECDPDTNTALINRDRIEHFADQCLQAWCEIKNLDPDTIQRVCTLYIKPVQEEDSVTEYLTGAI